MISEYVFCYAGIYLLFSEYECCSKTRKWLEFNGFVSACIIGGIILSAYCGILVYIGSDTRLNMDLLCRKAFGRKRSYLSFFLLGFTQIGWFGVGVAMFSILTVELLGINKWALTIVAELRMILTLATGMKVLEIVSTISVPLIVVIGVYSMVTATNAGGELVVVFSQSAGKITLLTRIGYVISSFISGGLALSNVMSVKMKFTTAIAGVVGTALAIWLYYNFTGWLNILNCALSLIGIIVILDFFLNRKKYKEQKTASCEVNGFNVLGISKYDSLGNCGS